MPKEKSLPYHAQIGLNIKVHRIKHKMTQAKVAGHLHVSVFQLQKYESGANKISLDKLHQLCALFNCPLKDILEEAPPEPFTAEHRPKNVLHEQRVAYGSKHSPPLTDDLTKLIRTLDDDQKLALEKFLKAMI